MAVPANADGFINIVFTGNGTDQTYTVSDNVYSIIFRAAVNDVTIDDENGIPYILPAGQAESINGKNMKDWDWVFNQAAAAGAVMQVRELFGKGV